MTQLYQNRLSSLRKEMKDQGVDLLIIGPTSDMTYLLGKKLPGTERFNALLVPIEGVPCIVVPGLQFPLIAEIKGLDIAKWEETDDPIAMTGDIAQKFKARTVAVDGLMRSSFLLRLQAQIGKEITFVDGGAITAQARLFKDSDEVAILKDAGARFDAIWQEFWEKGRLVGVTERDVVEQIRALLFAHGFESMDWCDVGSGPNGASPLHHHSDRIILPGDPVVIDFAGTMSGYFMDTCRTPVAGSPADDFVEIYDIVLKAHDAANTIALPGIAAEALDGAARDIITEAGYGKNFMHRLGHGLGLDPHEKPYIVSGNTQALWPGMVFSNEPGIYVDGRWGVRTENIMLMTDVGACSLNAAPRHLISMN